MVDLLTRGCRRIAHRLREVVPYFPRYRPQGIHPSSQALSADGSSGATYREVYPAHTSLLEVAGELHAQITDYGGLHAKPNRVEQLPPAFVVCLPQGRILADNSLSVAVISADNRLVGDVSFQYDAHRADLARPEANNVFRLRWFGPPTRVRGTVATLLAGGGAAQGNYYHWLIDSLPRLHLLKAAGLWDSIDYFLVYDKHRPVVADSLRALGIRPEQVLDVRTHRHLVADQLLATSPVRGTGTHTPHWACAFLRQALRPAAAPGSFGPLVYLSRRDALARHVLNEEAVEAFLRPLGFETHVLSAYSLAQQIALFAGAQVVVAPTGAGLANLVFSPDKTRVIELFPKHFTAVEYPELCYRLGFPHRFIVAAAANGPLHARRDGWREHLTVDLAALQQELAAFRVGPATAGDE